MAHQLDQYDQITLPRQPDRCDSVVLWFCHANSAGVAKRFGSRNYVLKGLIFKIKNFKSFFKKNLHFFALSLQAQDEHGEPRRYKHIGSSIKMTMTSPVKAQQHPKASPILLARSIPIFPIHNVPNIYTHLVNIYTRLWAITQGGPKTNSRNSRAIFLLCTSVPRQTHNYCHITQPGESNCHMVTL